SYVYVHDSARAFLDPETLIRLDGAAREKGSAVAGVPSKDTVRITDGEGRALTTPARKNVWIVQTPQVFRYEELLRAHAMAVENLEKLEADGIQITDDAMVAESMLGIRAQMVMASYNNIKVTTQEDLPLAEAILNDQKVR
ncbi:MAG: IspD/TarI family cytidylyltransferase, partial [bacterium]